MDKEFTAIGEEIFHGIQNKFLLVALVECLTKDTINYIGLHCITETLLPLKKNTFVWYEKVPK